MIILEKETSTIGEQPSNRLIQHLMQQRFETNSLIQECPQASAKDTVRTIKQRESLKSKSRLFLVVLTFLLAGFTIHTCDAQQAEVITGRVREENGAFVGNARVLLLGEAQVNDWLYSPQGIVLGSGNSTEDGTFRVVVDLKSQAPFRKFLIVCIADGFAMRSQELAYSFDLHDISIELSHKTRSIEGVIEGEDGKPIAGAVIALRSIRSKNREEPARIDFLRLDFESEPKLQTKTDTRGRFVLAGLGDEVVSVLVKVASEGLSPMLKSIDLSVEKDSTPVHLRVSSDPKLRIRGRLTESNRSLSGNGVELFIMSGVNSVVTQHTDVNSEFDCRIFEGETLTVAFRAPNGRLERLISGKPMKELDLTNLVLPMPELVASKSTLHDETLNPIPFYVDLRVLLPAGEPLKRGVVMNSRSEILKVVDGHCHFTDRRIGDNFRVYVLSEDRQFGATEVFALAGPQTQTVTLKPTITWETTLLGDDGQPLRNADFVNNRAVEMNLLLAFESGNVNCPALNEQERVVRGIHMLFDPAHMKLATDEEGRIRFSGLIPDAKYLMSKLGPLRTRGDGLPIYAGMELKEVIEVEGRIDNYLGFRVTKEISKQLPVISTRPVIDPVSGVSHANFGSMWALDQFADFDLAKGRLAALRKPLANLVLDLKAKSGSGSGVIVSPDGLVITCAHCVETIGEEVSLVSANGDTVDATVLSMCPELDLAMLKVKNLADAPVEFARRSEAEPTLGQWCIVLGYPGKVKEPVFRLERLLRFDGVRLYCSGEIMGGFSGGAVFDLSGNLIGIMHGGSHCAEQTQIRVKHINDNFERLSKGGAWRVIFE